MCDTQKNLLTPNVWGQQIFYLLRIRLLYALAV